MIADAKNKMDESRLEADEYEEQIAELKQQLSSSGNETPELDRKIAELEREIASLRERCHNISACDWTL